MKQSEYLIEVAPEKITAVRVSRGMSKRAVALAAGCTPAYMTLIEQGKQRAITNTVAAGIASALDINPESLFTGYAEAKAAAVGREISRRTLTPEEKEAAAIEYLDFVERVARENHRFLGFGIEAIDEAISISLVVFAEVLNTYDPSKGRRLETHIIYAIKNRLTSELRRNTSAKRNKHTFSLDAPVFDDSEADKYSCIPIKGQNIEQQYILREECREALSGLTTEQRNCRRIQDFVQELLTCVGF